MKTIIVSRTDKIGDFIVSIPSFATIRAMYPSCKIVALISRINRITASALRCIDEVVCIEDYSYEVLKQKIIDYKADAFIALLATETVIKLAYASKAPIRIGPKSKFLSFFVFNKGLRQRRSRCVKSEAQYNLDLVACLDPELFAETGVKNETIMYSESDAERVDSFLKDNGIEKGDKFILMNPVSGGSGANIARSSYSALINQACSQGPDFSFEEENRNTEHKEEYRRLPPEFVIMGIPEQKEKIEEIIGGVKEEFRKYVRVFLNEHSLLTAAALTDRCTVFIGPSTGITHIAGNYQKPVICFYSTRPSNSYTRWSLFGNNNEVPFTLDESRLNPETREIVDMSESMMQAIVSTALEEYYR